MSEVELQSTVQAARESLADAEAKLSELAAAMEPSTDIEEEERRLAEMGVKRQALERVIVARRRVLEEAEEALVAARAPRLRAELVAVSKEIDATLAEVVERLWAVYALTDKAEAYHFKTSELRLGLGDGGYGFATDAVRKLQATQAVVAGLLSGDLGVAKSVAEANSGRVSLKRRDFAAEAAKKESEAKRRQEEKAVREVKMRREAMLAGVHYGAE